MPTIYNVYADFCTGKPELHSLEVDEKPKLFRTKKGYRSGLAFGCGSQFSKDQYPQSPSVAWAQFLATRHRVIRNAKERIAIAEREAQEALVQIQKLNSNP